MPLKYSKHPTQLFKQINQFKKEIPRIAGVEAVNFFKASFRKQGWHNNTIEKWPARKTRVGRQTDKRAILVKSGALKKSIRIDRLTKTGVIVSSELPYSKIHNQGGRINKTAKVRAHQRRVGRGSTNVRSHNRRMNIDMPQRKFMGQSNALDNIIIRSLERRLHQITR